MVPSHQGKGLGIWLISCIDEVVSAITKLRRFMLLTGKKGPAVKFYERELGMSGTSLDEDGLVCMVRKGAGAGNPHH